MSYISIQVLGFGDLYALVLSTMSRLINNNDTFSSLLKITTLVGIIMASIGYIKQRNPMLYAKWVLGYVLAVQLLIFPTTQVEIIDLSTQVKHTVERVPVIFALTASLMTRLGIGIAQEYDELLSLDDDATYTKKGMLWGAQLIQRAIDTRIDDPAFAQEMNGFFRNCILGDININHKYTFKELRQSHMIWELITRAGSPLRMTQINGEHVTCQAAVDSNGVNQLMQKLQVEIEHAGVTFGGDLTAITQILNSYRLENSVLPLRQLIMVNAMFDALSDYQLSTDSTAGTMSLTRMMSDTQQRHQWAEFGQKAVIFLPMVHAIFLMLLFAAFPLVVVLFIASNATTLLIKYIRYVVVLQLWPVLFALLNTITTVYIKHKTMIYAGITLANRSEIALLFNDLIGVTGYLMCLIPWVANKMLGAFNSIFKSFTIS